MPIGLHAAAYCGWLAAALAQAVNADALDRYIAQETRLYELPAVVLGVMRDGRLVDTGVRGFANLELGVRANAELALVGHDRDDVAAATLSYRAVYPKVSRLLTLRIDSQGRIESWGAVDE